MTKIISVFNQKGGVGKTTTVINLGTALSRLNKKVLICDIDPQSNATSGLGINNNKIQKNIYDVLIDDIDPKEAILKTDYPNLHFLPSTVDLKYRNNSLEKALKKLSNIYNYILIDCPPSISLLTLNALVASDSVLIPIQCEYYSLEGIAQLLNTIDLVKKRSNPKLKIEGIVLTMADKRTKLTSQIIDEVKKYFRGLVYSTIIPRNIRLAEAPSFGKSIFDYDSNSTGARSYWKLAQEIINKQE